MTYRVADSASLQEEIHKLQALYEELENTMRYRSEEFSRLCKEKSFSKGLGFGIPFAFAVLLSVLIVTIRTCSLDDAAENARRTRLSQDINMCSIQPYDYGTEASAATHYKIIGYSERYPVTGTEIGHFRTFEDAVAAAGKVACPLLRRALTPPGPSIATSSSQ